MLKILTLQRISLILLIMFINQACINNSKQNNFNFVQMSDPQLGMGGYSHDTIAFNNAINQINSIKPDFVVICGDLVDSACNESFDDFIKIKSKFEVPVYLASGNHDVENIPTKNSLLYYRSKLGKDYFSFDYANSRFLVVNTQLWKHSIGEESDKHDEWFKNELKKAKDDSKKIYVVGHFPLFVKQADENENYFNLPIKKRFELLDLYKEFKVIAHLGGHVHRTINHFIDSIYFVNGETTSLNFDNRPLGFRHWIIKGDSVSNQFIELINKPDKKIKLPEKTSITIKNTGTQ